MSEWKVPGYTELRALGSGSFGDVVLARYDASGILVAIKYLRADLLADADSAEMFRGEAEVLASLDDQNVVRLYEYVESVSGAAIVMELIDGVSLREILAHQGSTTAEAALVVLQGSLLGLGAAHQRGVVHRDYKPENVLVDGAGASKLTDFGIAARAGDRPVPAGTLLYAPPEQIAGAAASPASDVYSATATFYECLVGRPPFSGKTSAELMRQHSSEPVLLDPVPEPLRPLVSAGMAKEPENRPTDASSFVTELHTAAAGAYGPGWDERGRSHLGEAALALAALWPSGQAPAVHGSAVHRIDLSEDTGESPETRHLWHIRHLRHLRHLAHLRALVAVGAAVAVVAAGTAVAATTLGKPKLAADTHPAPAQTLSLQSSPPSVSGNSPSVSPALKSPAAKSSPASSAPLSSAPATPAPATPAPVTSSPSKSSSPKPSPKKSPKPSPSPSSGATVCQPDGTGCTKAGTYPGPGALISSDYSGFKVVWTESVVAPYSPGVPQSWSAYVTYTNIEKTINIFSCTGAWIDAAYVSEHMTGGKGNDGTASAGGTTCSEEPSAAIQVPPGGTVTALAVFHNVPWPGVAVAITWGNAGTSAYVYPFT